MRASGLQREEVALVRVAALDGAIVARRLRCFNYEFICPPKEKLFRRAPVIGS
jgi:hypothetical protein